MIAVSTALTRILRKAHAPYLRTDVLYYYVREAFSFSSQPPSMKEYKDVLRANQDDFWMDGDGYIYLAEAYVQTAADEAHGEEQQSSKRACVHGLQASSQRIHSDGAHGWEEQESSTPAHLHTDGLQDNGGQIHLAEAQPWPAATWAHSDEQASSDAQFCSEG